MRISDWSSDVCSSDLVDFALAIFKVHQFLDDSDNVFAAQRGDRILGIEIETHVELDAADGRKIVTFRIEKQAVEQRFRCLTRGRFARAHDAINIGERMIAIFRLVCLQRVAHPGASSNMINIEQLEMVDPRLVELRSEEHTSELQSL